MKSILTTLTIASIVVNINCVYSQSDNSNSTKTEKIKVHSNISFGFEFGIQSTFRNSVSSSEKAIVKCRDSHEKATINTSFGLVTDINLNRRWSVLVGIRYAKLGFESKKVLVDFVDDAALQLFNICPENGYEDPVRWGVYQYGYYDPRLSFAVTGSHPGEGYVSYRISYEFIELPLKIKYHIGGEKFSPYAAVGVGINYLINSKREFDLEITSGNAVIEDKDYSLYKAENYYTKNDYYNKLQIAGLLELGLDYNPSKKWRITFAGEYQYSLSTLIIESISVYDEDAEKRPVKEYLYKFGGLVRVAYVL